jgi:sarcosine oxidase
VNTSTSRRNFLKGAATAGAVSLMGSHTFATPRQVSVIVVGAGAFGGWSALHLAQAGAKVTLLDAWGPGNSRASSGGETRTIRATYGPAHVLYAKMVATHCNSGRSMKAMESATLLSPRGAPHGWCGRFL